MTAEMGRVEVICGSMFSGKSEELIRRAKRGEIAKKPVQIFKPIIDSRYGGVTMVNAHSGLSAGAQPIEDSSDIFDLLKSDTRIVCIDEAQFLDAGIVDVVKKLAAERNLRVIVAGLDLDFRGEPFGPMPTLIADAEIVDKLHAICVVCGEDASRTQRIVNGVPANYHEPIVVIGAQESYEARCRHCHIVPGKDHDDVYRSDG